MTRTILLSLMLAVTTFGAPPPSDKAQYKTRQLLPREIQEEADRDRFLASRKGKPYSQAEAPIGRTLTFDFSNLVRPRKVEEFKSLWHTPPKRQWWTNTCWSFCTTSFLESEIKRLHGREIKLSEMFTVYWEYVEKAKEYVRTRGKSLFAEGSEPEAVLLRGARYGVVPEEAYPGLPDGQKVFNHELLIQELTIYLQGVEKEGTWDETTVVRCIRAILDKHMGPPPQEFEWHGQRLSPQAFLSSVAQLDLSHYVSFMSLLHVPFWTQGEFPVPDNWWHSKSYHNVPLDTFSALLRDAVRSGFTVTIAGDVSEPGYEGAEDCAIVPTFDCPPEAINQSSREFRFANHTTQDDHGLHVVGHVTKDGHDWYLVKDSARTSQRGIPGYTFYRDDYIRLKMLVLVVHRDAVKDLLARF